MRRVTAAAAPSVRFDPLHDAQAEIAAARARFVVACCGRRFGKTHFSLRRAVHPALAWGKPVGLFWPTYKDVAQYWRDLKTICKPVTADKSEQEKRIELTSGGVIDCWSLEDPDAGRGRKYRRILVDEAAKARHLEAWWNEAGRPTLSDYRGDAFFFSTPKGRNFFWRLHRRGDDPASWPDWRSFTFPTSSNPYIHPDEIEAARKELPERAFSQEYLAQFLDDSGGVFRGVYAAILDGQSANVPPISGARYYLGLDLARIEDFTVISIVDSEDRQVYFERFNQISWERQIAAVKRAADAYDALCIVDATGVGDVIVERLRDAGLRILPVKFTQSSKRALIDSLAVQIESGRAKLLDIPEQTGEFLAYEYQTTAAGNFRTSAPAGMHDDTVIARALASWGAGGNGVVRVA